MIPRPNVHAQIAALQREVTLLHGVMRSTPPTRRSRLHSRPAPNEQAQSAPSAISQTQAPTVRHHRCRKINRRPRVTIAPGIKITTLPGTLYATTCKILAERGQLAEHDTLFAAFLKTPDKENAVMFLQLIGVTRAALEHRLDNDEEYRAHREKRSQMYQQLAAAGDPRYQKFMNNLRIVDADGNWRGNVDEALATLYGARKITLVHRRKNLQILNKAGLMFDSFTISGAQYCFLYKQKWHRVFRRAAALAKS